MDQIQIAQELLNRRQARTNLLSFYQYCFSKFIPGKHIEKMCSALEQIESGKIKRLIISCPPQHSKSTTASIFFPSWYMGRNPDKKVVLASYSQTMAEMQSRKAKDLFYSSEYQKLFPKVVPALNSKYYKNSDHEYETRQRGSLYAVGIGGSLTGRGYDLGIIDDYVASRLEANSDTCRRNNLEWYQSTFLTRQSPTATIVIIATRWQVDDLIGTILKEEKDLWEVIALPAVNDLNEALWPERFDLIKLEEIRKSIGSFEWSALYQGNPIIRGGNRFKVDNIIFHDSLKDFPQAIYMRAWDLASSAKERSSDDPDYTVGTLGTIIKNKVAQNEMWIKDIQFLRKEAPERDALVLNTAIKDGPSVAQYVEGFGAYKDAYTTLRRVLMGRNIVRKSILPGDKSVKAAPLEPIIEAGNLHVLNGVWTELFKKQMAEFPNGVHDDICDSLSIIAGEYHKSKSSILITT
jgi:hypothetical protein